MAELSLSSRLFCNPPAAFARCSCSSSSSHAVPKTDQLSMKVKQSISECHDLLSTPNILQFMSVPDVKKTNSAMKQLMKYPFQELPDPVVGGRSFFQIIQIMRMEEEKYAVIKVGENGFELLVEDDEKVLRVTGEEEDQQQKGRKYEFSIQFRSSVFPYYPYFKQMKTEMKNGILYIVFPLT